MCKSLIIQNFQNNIDYLFWKWNPVQLLTERLDRGLDQSRLDLSWPITKFQEFCFPFSKGAFKPNEQEQKAFHQDNFAGVGKNGNSLLGRNAPLHWNLALKVVQTEQIVLILTFLLWQVASIALARNLITFEWWAKQKHIKIKRFFLIVDFFCFCVECENKNYYFSDF